MLLDAAVMNRARSKSGLLFAHMSAKSETSAKSAWLALSVLAIAIKSFLVMGRDYAQCPVLSRSIVKRFPAHPSTGIYPLGGKLSKKRKAPKGLTFSATHGALSGHFSVHFRDFVALDFALGASALGAHDAQADALGAHDVIRAATVVGHNLELVGAELLVKVVLREDVAGAGRAVALAGRAHHEGAGGQGLVVLVGGHATSLQGKPGERKPNRKRVFDLPPRG